MTSCSSRFHGLGLFSDEENLFVLIIEFAKVGEEELNKNSLSKMLQNVMIYLFCLISLASSLVPCQNCPFLKLDLE